MPGIVGTRIRGSTSGSQALTTDRLAYHRFAADMLRARGVLVLACILWLVVGTGLELMAFPVLGRGSMAVPLALRYAASVYHAFVLIVLFRSPLPSQRFTLPVVASIFPVTSLFLGLLSTRVGGVNSPYYGGMVVILTVQALAFPLPWRRGL